MSNKYGIVGSPVAHSKSPAIHTAAYRVLDLDWSYSRNEVTKGSLASFLSKLEDDWRGLSVTAPLKNEANKLATKLDEYSKITGSTNTLIRNSVDGWDGYNTDIFGIVQAIQSKSSSAILSTLIVGSGATAHSAIVAVSTLAPLSDLRIYARNSRTRRAAIKFAKSLGLNAKRALFFETSAAGSDLVISSVPAHAMDEIADKLKKRHLWHPSGILLDVSYSPWPSKLAELWQSSTKPVISGLDMLIWQAIAQLRLFLNSNVQEPLPNEIAVLEAMRVATAQ
ncbi:MAG: shikimate dehydrogenase family protein [Rhodoluna sp.]